MADPVILGAVLDGWQTVFDYGTGSSEQRVLIMMGPAMAVDTQVAAIKAAKTVDTFDVSVSPGSAVATIRATYNTRAGSLPTGERRWPVYAAQSAMVSVDLKANPQLATIAAIMPKIDRLIAEGRIDDITSTYGASELALRYARMPPLAGATSYEAPAFTLCVTRYYTSAPSIASDYASINKVFAWPGIKTDGKSIPGTIDEPKYTDAAGTAKAYEWRLISVAPVIQRGQDNAVQWQFLGLERWAKWFYNGGTWEPASL